MPSSIRPNRLRLWFKVGLVVALVFTFAVGSASAGTIDPSTIHIGDSPTPPPGTSPNQIGDSGLVYVFQNAGNVGPLYGQFGNSTNPQFLLILGIPEPGSGSVSFSDASISSVNGNNNSASTTNGWAYDSSLTGTMTASSSQDAYGSLGLSGTAGGKPNDSNNWTNWSAVESPTLNSFSLYVFDINTTLSSSSGPVSIQFATGALPAGAIVIAYGETLGGTNPNPYDVPWTQAGFTQGGNGGGGGVGGGVVPAPPSVVLLGFGGFGLAFILVRSRRRLAAA